MNFISHGIQERNDKCINVCVLFSDSRIEQGTKRYHIQKNILNKVKRLEKKKTDGIRIRYGNFLTAGEKKNDDHPENNR